MRAWFKGVMTTIGLKLTNTYAVAWAAEGDTRAIHKLERIVIEIVNIIISLKKKCIIHNNTFIIRVLLEYLYITADHHALPSVTAIKNNIWRVDRFEQQTNLLWRHIKQAYDFILTLSQYWNRYQSELDWIKENEMVIESGNDTCFKSYQAPLLWHYRIKFPGLGVIKIGISILHSGAVLVDLFFDFAQLMLEENTKKKNGKFEDEKVGGLLTKIVSSTKYWQSNKGGGKLVMGAQKAYKQIQKFCVCFGIQKIYLL